MATEIKDEIFDCEPSELILQQLQVFF